MGKIYREYKALIARSILNGQTVETIENSFDSFILSKLPDKKPPLKRADLIDMFANEFSLFSIEEATVIVASRLTELLKQEKIARIRYGYYQKY